MGLLLVVSLGLAPACARVRKLRAENARLGMLARIEGTLDADEWRGDPLSLVILQAAEQGVPGAVQGEIPLNEPGEFSATMLPDVYVIGAYEDRNANGKYDYGERAGAYKEFRSVDLRAGGVAKDIHVHITQDLPQILRGQPEIDFVAPTTPGEGSVAALSDQRFTSENGALGVWEPATFQERFGLGVFMLQPYDAAKIPVLFVHGMGGHPGEFAALIHCLEAEHFQPWVAQYASGLPLEPVALNLSYLLTKLQRRHHFARLYLVAHSMGALVARRLLTEHVASNPRVFISEFVSIGAPFGGIGSADVGVRWARAVVPSWRDIGPRSAFIAHLFDKPLPKIIDFSLFFVYREKGASDGVVGLQSQLRREARREARHFMAFENTHSGVLKDPELCKALAEALPIMP